ncbi:MAG: ECF-type sigma factor [Planctomycetota bacterium]
MNQDSSADQHESEVSGAGKTAESLFEEVYDELHSIAKRQMSSERAGHTLQTTALIGEAYLSLMKGASASQRYESYEHFLGVAAVAMRRVLINHAKAKKTLKRSALPEQLLPVGVTECFQQRSIDLLTLDQALQRLASIDAKQARIVELRFFGGMTAQQCATMLGLSERTVQYEWAHARAWLRRQVEET